MTFVYLFFVLKVPKVVTKICQKVVNKSSEQALQAKGVKKTYKQDKSFEQKV